MLDQELPLMEHLVELRERLIKIALALVVGTVVSLAFTAYLLEMLTTLPTRLGLGGTLTLINQSPTEGISNYFKVALISGITLAMPIIVYQVLRFVLPALTKQEKRYLLLIVPGAAASFVIGVLFAYFFVLRAAIVFLGRFGDRFAMQMWTVETYISFATTLLFWLGLSFELPLVVFFLAKMRFITHRTLVSRWRLAIVIAAVAAAVITPTPDPGTMSLVMMPLLLLYLISVVLAFIATPRDARSVSSEPRRNR